MLADVEDTKKLGGRLGFMYPRVNTEPALAEIHLPVSRGIQEEATLIAS